jgi:outer membrane protein OmpA-like peptidoglycan-associated protein/tetratricopeptide (TPR) repeat protein
MKSQAQKTKSTIQLADEYFAAGEYYTAANLYGQFLNPPKKQKIVSDFPLNIKGRRNASPAAHISKNDILYKQAESYRLANYWQDAAASYKKCIDEDVTKYPDAIYWYAVCQRSLEHYDTAWESIKQYLNLSGDHAYKNAAEEELQTLQYIQQQLARPDSVLVKTKKINALNSDVKGIFAPVHLSDDQFLFTSTQTDSVQMNGVNPYHSRLFYTVLKSDSLEEMEPVELSSPDPAINQGAASMSADGKFLYFTEWEKEKGQIISSIYFSAKQTGGWGSPILLPWVNREGYNSKQPFFTSDGKYLFFASDCPGGSGKFDIWYAPVKDDGTTGEPINAGTLINTSEDEQAPFYQNSSNTLVFSSNGHKGMGSFDLFATKGSETNWKQPENLGYPVNSSRDDIYFFAPEKTRLLADAIVSSDRGQGCCLETYNIVKAPKDKKLSGKLNDCNENTPVADAEIILKDGSGKTWRTTTNAEGKYVFDLGTEEHNNLSLSVNKFSYIDTTSAVNIQNTDESDLLVDKLTNADLCIQQRPKPKPVEIIIKAENVVTVYFDFDKSNLKPAATEKLDSIYNVLVQYPSATIQISGYTDGLGSDAYNKILSDKRAKACADYLIKKGIDSTRVSFLSFGACCPVEMEKINGRDNPDGRSRNRRALINVNKEE